MRIAQTLKVIWRGIRRGTAFFLYLWESLFRWLKNLVALEGEGDV